MIINMLYSNTISRMEGDSPSGQPLYFQARPPTQFDCRTRFGEQPVKMKLLNDIFREAGLKARVRHVHFPLRVAAFVQAMKNLVRAHPKQEKS